VVPLTPSLEISAAQRLQAVRSFVHKSIYPHLPSEKYIRLWYKSKLLKVDSLSLRKYQISQDSTFVIQVLKEEDRCCMEDFPSLFFIHRRRPDNSGFFAPIEFYFHGVTKLDLIISLSQAFDIPQEVLLIAKYGVHTALWELLLGGYDAEDAPPTKPPTAQNNKKTPNDKQNKKQIHVIARRPFGLTDGSLIVIGDKRDDPQGLNLFFTLLTTSGSVYKEEQDSKTKSTGRRYAEVALKISVEDAEEFEYEELIEYDSD